jgi:hypothetical protein
VRRVAGTALIEIHQIRLKIHGAELNVSAEDIYSNSKTEKD